MSTPEMIRARLAVLEGIHLTQLAALAPEPLPNRTLWVSSEVLYAVEPPFSDDHDGERLWRFRGLLDAFANRYRFSVAEDPRYKASNVFLARVAPVRAEFWDLRSLEPPKGIRCFGCFAGLDEFIALTWNYRELISDFDEAVSECQAEWTKLFGDLTPHSGGSLDAYLTNYRAV